MCITCVNKNKTQAQTKPSLNERNRSILRLRLKLTFPMRINFQILARSPQTLLNFGTFTFNGW